MFGRRQLDAFQAYALRLGILGRLVARVTLSDKRNFNRFTSRLLHFLGQFGYLGAFLFIGWCDKQR